MLIPSIDLQSGKAVQLRQGKTHVLTAERDPLELAPEFNRYGEVAVIDLDAAMETGDNMPLIKSLCRVADVRAGGGIRTVERGRALLRAGAQKIIIGTAATPEFLSGFPKRRVQVALDHLKTGEVVDHGWAQGTGEDVMTRAKRLEPYCSGFLCTFVDDEGQMTGMAPEAVQALQKELSVPITVAGGISTTENAAEILRLGVDVQVGMALYTGKLDPVAATVQALDFKKMEGLIPTIVQDAETEQVLMLAYSTPESLSQALHQGKGIYFSRSRNELWEKGASSGHTQQLVTCRADCDNDTLLFRVIQQGPACHTGASTCFGTRRANMGGLFQVLNSRKSNLPVNSFTAKLFQDRKFLLRKIMEETSEVVLADSFEELRWEIADSLFFLSTLAVAEGLTWQDLVGELGGREP